MGETHIRMGQTPRQDIIPSRYHPLSPCDVQFPARKIEADAMFNREDLETQTQIFSMKCQTTRKLQNTRKQHPV